MRKKLILIICLSLLSCISQAPAKVPFEVYNGFLLEFNSKIVYNRKNKYSRYCEGVL